MTKSEFVDHVAQKSGLEKGQSGKAVDAVLAVIEELDYRPSSAAQQLAAGRTRTIGLLIPFFGNMSSFERLRGIMQVLSVDGYDVALADVETGEQRGREFASLTSRSRVDGTIVVSLVPTRHELDLLSRAEVPIVLLDRVQDGFPYIAIDDVEGGLLATRHLLALGHRRIGFVGDLPTRHHFTSSADRRRGYRKALAEAGIGPDDALVAEGPNGREEADRLADALLSLPDPPTAIFAASDVQALGVIAAARRRGLRVPEDLSVIGFDDIELASHVGLSTVRQFLPESGEEAARMLLRLLRGEEPAEREVLLRLSVVPRASTAPRA